MRRLIFFFSSLKTFPPKFPFILITHQTQFNYRFITLEIFAITQQLFSKGSLESSIQFGVKFHFIIPLVHTLTFKPFMES